MKVLTKFNNKVKKIEIVLKKSEKYLLLWWQS